MVRSRITPIRHARFSLMRLICAYAKVRWQSMRASRCRTSRRVLLGQVLEEATGRPVCEAIADRAMAPAGMADSGYFRFDEATPDVAVGYLPREPGEPWRTNVFSVRVVGGGDGGAHATARDIARVLRALAAGRLLGDELGALMQTRHVPVAEDFWMGYGLFLRGDGSLGHGGGDPGVETMARHWPDQDLTVVVLCNVEDALGPAWELLLAAVGSA
jgi:CubicO group peptidase (beta-lactamase class C family)